MKKNRLILLLTATCSSICLYGQTGAAGVGSSATNVFWLDAHALNGTAGSPVSSFTDVSGNGNNFIQATSSKRPVYQTAIINGMPALDYDGVNDALQSGAIPAMNSANMTYFLVYSRTPLVFQNLLGGNYTSAANKWWTGAGYADNRVFTYQYSPTGNHVSYVETTSGFLFSSHHITPTQMRTYKQGTLAMTKNVTYTTPSGHNWCTLGNIHYPHSSNWTLNGYIAEAIMYNTSLNALQRILVENYLGCKYGMAIPTDLYAYQATHQIGLVGLGNDGTSTQTDAQGTGILEIENPTAMASAEYLLVAHEDVVLTEFTTADIPPSLTGDQRFTRTWRADETGDVGTVTITFHLSGLSDFGTSSSYRLLVDTDGNFTDATIVSGSYSGGDVTFTHDFTGDHFFTLSGNPSSLDIISVTSGMWNDPGTWDCTCVPGSTDNVTIDTDHNIEVDVDAFSSSLTINPDGTLSMPSDFDLTLFKDFTISGNLSLTAGAIVFDGADDQFVNGASQTTPLEFFNIMIESNGDVNFSNADEFVLNGKLSPNSGSMSIDSPALFVVNSTSATTEGRIGPIVDPFTFTGDFTVRRFIPAGVADWRELCSPVIGLDFNSWDDDIAISGPGMPDGCAYGAGDCFNSIAYWSAGNYVEVDDVSESLLQGRGFEVFIGDDLTSWAGGTLDVTGPIQSSADKVITMNPGGWYTIGNPYACPVTFMDVAKSGNVGNYFYIYDNTTGDYQWWDGSSGSSSSIPELTDGLVDISQGFWVFTSGLGTATFSENNKSDNDALYIRGPHSDGNTFFVNLTEHTTTYSSNIAFEASPDGMDGYDQLDLLSLSTGKEKASKIVISNDQLLRKNHLADDGRDKSFDIHTTVQREGYYTISGYNWENFAHYNQILLVDSETQEMVNLKETDYVFYSSEGEFDRFRIVFTNAVSNNQGTVSDVSSPGEDVVITQMGNLINVAAGSESTAGLVTVTVSNIVGQQSEFTLSAALVEGSNIIELPQSLRGVYIFTILFGEKAVSKKIVLE